MDERLAEWQQRTDEATEGPWEQFGSVVETVPDFDLHRVVARVDDPLNADAAFIVAAREAMPKLLSAVEVVLALTGAIEYEDGPFGDGRIDAMADIRQAINDALGTED